ncbi:MAG TPA: hypothetical protein PK095_15930 [Myxococcota bacterium]|nr:hypothetical protein [Myxococcota bacterium]
MFHRFGRFIAPTAMALWALGATPAHANPNFLTVQGYLTNQAGTAINGTYGMKFSLFTAQNGGTLLWEESQTGIVVNNGVFDDVLGDVNPVANPLRVDYFRNNAEVWLQIQLQSGPGVAPNEAPLPRQRLATSAYTFSSQHATTATTATSASTATTATTATTAATATTAQGLACNPACVAITELDFDPATQLELNNAIAGLVSTTALNTTLGNYVTTASLNTALGNYATTASLANYATTASLSAYATTAAMNTAISAALQPYSNTAAMNSAISTALQPYSTTAQLNTAISSAVSGLVATSALNTAISTALQPYATTTSVTSAINTALSGFATSASVTSAINTALQNYSTTTAMNAAITSALGGYATTAAVSSSITTALQNYSTTAQMNAAINAALTNYATNTAVTNAINTALQPYAMTASVNSAISAALTNYVTSNALGAALAGYAQTEDVPTSLTDLAGGTVTGNIVATATVEAPVVKQNGNTVCDESGNCGRTLDDISCQAGETLEWDGSNWSCVTGSTGGSGPTQPCIGAYKALQYDGSDWNCIDIRASGLSGGRANGYEVIDAWGYAWDGTERGAKNWDAARTECESIGARLPTVTELFRNNATSGTGNLGTTANSNELWTLIQNLSLNRQTVRVSDGGINARGPTNNYNFRCVWPDRTSATFDGNYCYGPAGAECARVRRWYNMDHYNRPPLDMGAATQECAFYNASVPSIEDWTEAIHSGELTGNFSTWLWGNDVLGHTGAPHLLHPILKFDAARAKVWTYQNTFGDWAWPTTAISFRCIGKRPGVGGVDPAVRECNGGCFALGQSNLQTPDKAGRRSQIWADSRNRTATNRATALAQCRTAGGTLPTAHEFGELVRAGMPFDNAASEHTAWLWTNSPIYYPSSYSNMLARRGTVAQFGWSIHHSNTMTWDNSGTVNYGFRCVWHQTQRGTPFTCEAGQDVNYDGTQYSCSDRVLGTSNGQALDGPWNDNWGNEWDFKNRPAATAAVAATTCSGLGGRLPTPTELYRVRSGGPNTIPFATAVYLWTNIPGYAVDTTATIRLTDGALSQTNSAGASALEYRCIWPTSKGSVLGNYSCSGPTNAGQEPCFKAGRYTVDKQDRAFLYPSSAAEECRFYGGWLQSLRGFEELIHLGNPNGSNVYSWLMEPMYAGAYYQAMGRWSGAGAPAWYWSNAASTTTLGGPEEANRTFRCAFHDILR